MKNLFSLVFICFITIAFSSCLPKKKLAAPHVTVNSLTDTTLIRDGSLIYSLPRTVFTVNVEMERTITIPGPYARYAEDLLGLKGVIMNADERWTIKGISVSSHEEADPSEFYVIETNTAFRSNVLDMKKEGIILDINPATILPGGNMLDHTEPDLDQFRSTDLGSDAYYISQTDTAYRRVALDSTFVRVPYLVEKKRKLSTDQLAENAARKLMDLRDGRFLILTGEANVFPQSPDAINEINRLEKEYSELFTGKTITEKRTFTCQVIPEAENRTGPYPVMIFSEESGFAEKSSVNGTPVTMAFEPEKKNKDITIISHKQPGDPSSQPGDRLYYRIPDVVIVRILTGDETVYRSRRLVYQFGEVMQLPSNYIIGN